MKEEEHYYQTLPTMRYQIVKETAVRLYTPKEKIMGKVKTMNA